MSKTLVSNPAKTAALILRLGLAFVFAYAAISALQHPLEWVGYLPSQVTGIIVATSALKILSILQLILAAWLLTGTYVKVAAIVAGLMLLGIIAANGSQLITTFRDIGLLAAAAALYLLD